MLAIGGVSIFYRKLTGKSIDEVADEIIDSPTSLLNSKKNKKVIGNNSFKSKNKADNIQFNEELGKIINQFDLVLKSKNNEDYPPPFWYDIVIGRAVYMKEKLDIRPISKIESEWVWMHADEYENKYSSYIKKDIVDAMSLRIKRFGFIYTTMLDFEKKLNSLAHEYNLPSFTYLDEFIINRSSAFASLYGTIKFSLSVGMSNSDIKKLYGEFIYDKVLINGTNPFDEFGITKEEANSVIKDKLGVDMDNFKTNQNTINKRASSILSQLSIEKRYAIFTVLCHIANSDGMTTDENIVLQDILLELEIDSNKYNNANLDGNQAVNLLQNLNQEQKEELSRFIVLIVGADAKFSSQEMILVSDVVNEIGIDSKLISKLIEKYW